MADRIRACDRRRERSFPPPSGAAALSAWLVAFSATPLPRCIGCDLQPITADAHAAPASCSFLAGVTKMEHAVIAFPYAGSIYIREQLRSAVRQGGKQVFGLLRHKIRLRQQLFSTCLQSRAHGMARHPSIQLIDC